MGSKKYPLEPLVDVRREHADAATRQLGESVRVRETREAELAAARARTLQHADTVHATEHREREALEQGTLRALDLARQNAWQLQQEREAEELAHRESRSAEAVLAAADEETQARAQTAARLAELKAVERDRERFREREKKVALAKEEEAAEEAWRPQSG